MVARWWQALVYLALHAPVQVAAAVRVAVVLALLWACEAPGWVALVYGVTESATVTWAQEGTRPKVLAR